MRVRMCTTVTRPCVELQALLEGYTATNRPGLIHDSSSLSWTTVVVLVVFVRIAADICSFPCLFQGNLTQNYPTLSHSGYCESANPLEVYIILCTERHTDAMVIHRKCVDLPTLSADTHVTLCFSAKSVRNPSFLEEKASNTTLSRLSSLNQRLFSNPLTAAIVLSRRTIIGRTVTQHNRVRTVTLGINKDGSTVLDAE